MATKIEKRIVGWTIKKDAPVAEEQASETTSSILPNKQKLARPKVLLGATYKIKNALQASHGIYMTVNHTEESGLVLPFELFLNTKNVDLQPMMQVLSLTLTTMFRTRTDISHLLQEFKTIQSDKGGYWSRTFFPKPRYYTHLVGEIADVLEQHLASLNKEHEIEEIEAEAPLEAPAFSSVGVCPECSSENTGRVDGCFTCRDCGYSKCG